MVRPENPHHKVADYGHGEVQFNEYPEFATWQAGADAQLRAVVEDLREAERRQLQYHYRLALKDKADEYEAELEGCDHT